MFRGQLVASAARVATDGDWRANFAQGAEMRPHVASRDEAEVAAAVMTAVGLDTGGVDLVSRSGGTTVLEVNPSPGLEGIEEALGENVAGKLAALMLEMVAQESDIAGA
jgi:ribosomal protein S6--L-glutamate ligase